METCNVHVAGCWNDEDARGGVGVYWGPNDARNISARCGNAITDADSATLDAVIRFLEQLGANSDCSTAPHDGNHFTVRTDNSNIVVWLTVNLPSWKEYSWEGDIQHKSLLCYIDALIENARVQASIEVSFLLCSSFPPTSRWPKWLAGSASTSDKMPPDPELKTFDERVYAVTMLELYTLSVHGISPTSPRVDVALKRLRESRRCLKAAERDRDAPVQLQDDVSSARTEDHEVEILSAVNEQERPRQHTELRSIPQKDTTQGNQTGAPVASSSSEFSAPVRSSEYYASHTAIPSSRLLGTLARVCESLIPAFEESNVMWPDIRSGMQRHVLKELIALLRKYEPHKVEKGGKRKANGEPAASSHNDKKQKVSNSESVPTTEQKANIFDHIFMHPRAIARRLSTQAKGRRNVPVRMVFVFCKSELTSSAALLNHLPHLIGEVNARCKKEKTVKLVRFSEGARKVLSELWDFGTFDAFAIEQNTCDMAQLWDVLSSVPLVKRA